MPDGESPPKFGNPGFKLPKDLSLDSKMDLRDAMVDKKHESQTTPKHQSIAFDPELINSPLSKYKLQSAFDHKNSEYFPKAAFEKEIWVSKRVRELQEAFSKCRKAESSISGCIESSDRWSAKEGTAQDLRYTLLQILERHGPLTLMYKGHDALGRHWISGWKWTNAKSEQRAVVVCVEEEEERKAKNKSPSSLTPIPAFDGQAEYDKDWVLVEDIKEE